jgi:hypothetical protein
MVEVIERPKEVFSWIGPLIKLMVGSEHEGFIRFHYSDRMNVAPLISKDMKKDYPERVYRTKKEIIGDKTYLKVWRLPDVKVKKVIRQTEN